MALHPERLNFISLCTGGGGLDLGIGLALPDAHAIVMVEREAFAVGHLVAAIEEGLMAPAAIWSDVRTFDGRPFRGLVDGLVGGIPCQPHSLAGKRLAEDDERDLWSDARRIIVQSRPWFVVIENVEGMLTSGGAERVVRDLRRLRFTVEIGLFSASETGASHQRNRVFIVAVADTGREQWRPRRTECNGAAGGRSHDQPAGSSFELADAISDRRPPGIPAPAGRYGVGTEPAIAYDDSGKLGDASIKRRGEGQPQPSLRSGRHTAGCASGAVDDTTDRDRSLHAGRGRSRQGEIDAGRASAADAELGLFPPGPSDLDGWRRVLAHSPHLEPAVRRMADGVAARLDLSGPHAARIERLRMLGNGVVCLEAAYALRTLCARLAADGSRAAAQLVRMMGEA